MDLIISVCEIWDLGLAYLGIWGLGFVSILGENVFGGKMVKMGGQIYKSNKFTGSTGHQLHDGVKLPNFNGFAKFCYLT